MYQKLFPSVISAVFLLTSCLNENSNFEAEPSLGLDKPEISVGADPVVDTLLITANRPWSVIPDPQCDWVEFDMLEHINIVGDRQTTPLAVSFADNIEKAARNASFKIVGEGFSQTVALKQAAIVYRLSVTSPHKVDDIDDRGDDILIDISTNYNWTARVKEGSTANVTLQPSSGYRSTSLIATLGKNTDMINGKTATVVIEVPECQPVEVVLNQKAAVPYIECYVPQKDRYVDPNVFSSVGGVRWFNIESNTRWTASVNESETTAKGVTLPVTSGDGNFEAFNVKVTEANKDFDSTKKIVIDFKPENGEVYKYEMTQQKGSIIDFEFRNQDNSKSYYPFIDPATNPSSTNKGEGWFYVTGGYCLHCYSTNSLYLHSRGFQCGGGLYDYIEFPSIEDKTLVRVTLIDYNGSTKPSIKDSNDKPVDGGEYSSTFTYYKPFTWNLSGTEKGKAYRMGTNIAKSFRVINLELEYK